MRDPEGEVKSNRQKMQHSIPVLKKTLKSLSHPF